MRKFALISILLIFFFTNCSQNNPDFDILILNGTIYDGTGQQPIQADIGIKDDQIIAIGNLSSSTASKSIDAKGLAVSPGFIDMHTHLEPLMDMPLAESLVRQGVTLALGGPDGGSPWPFGSYLDSLSNTELGINVAYLIGHNTIRKEVMGLEDREPTGEELELMKRYVQQAMNEGAFGISTGLKYLPGTFAKIDEVIELSKVAANEQGIYTSHLREEGLGLLDAVKEAILISREAQIPVVLTHHKAIGVKMWGASTKTLSMVDSARKIGLDIMMDQYPYTASHTGISVLIPSWAMEGGDFARRIENPVLKDSIKKGIIYNILNDRGGKDLNRIQFSRVEWDQSLEGKTLQDWVEREEMEPTIENGAELVIQAQLNGGTGTIYHAMDESDVERIMKHPMTMIGSDGRLSRPGDGQPHPRAYGTFPRVLGYYVREKKILSLPEAIHKMTGLSAGRLALSNRGLIKVENIADITIFDPETIIDKSTFTDPHQYPEGIEYVIINGKIAIDKGKYLAVPAGKVIRKTAKD
ncbi:N-acyl-D-amino-acid deacylase family protein [Algoriphagus marinus]|uniref:N-acyl-D-amino-acid deacylase family protein n=1 Tax=Algoriphagus marinus TaxID=1925762 RepID=UPI00094B9BAB|nr:D-aminoacylase [Algoriphagus marinus]